MMARIGGSLTRSCVEQVAELLGLARLEGEERAVGGVVGLDVVEVGEHLHVVARALDVDEEDDAALLVEALGDELGGVRAVGSTVSGA